LAAGKIKARKKALQKADEILGIQTRLADWLQTHLRYVLIGGAAVLLIAVYSFAVSMAYASCWGLGDDFR